MIRVRNLIVVLCTIISVALTRTNASPQQDSRERRELAMADQAILATIAQSASTNGRRICIDSPVACLGPDKAELGLALIGARSTKDANLALVGLLGYQLDGAVAEDYVCYVLRAGDSTKPDLLRASPEVLAARCKKELQWMIADRTASLGQLDEDSVCAAPIKISKKLKELTNAISIGEKCSAGDF